MAESGADRSRRYRRHKAGDHSLCDPQRCRGDASVTSRRATRGERLWRELGGDDLTGAQRALAEEACRIADRLDKLDRLLTGGADDWVGLVEDKGDPDRQIVVIDRPLAEARQQAIALKQIVSELRQSAAKVEAPKKPEGGADDLAARRAARRAAAGL